MRLAVNCCSIPGAFLIPYVLFVAVGSLPVFFLEVTLGQFTNRGSALAFGVVPIMKGKPNYPNTN